MRDELFCELISWSNILRSFKQAEKGRRWKEYILKFFFYSGQMLAQLKEDLASKKYVHGKYRSFTVWDSKKRVINTAPFRDRIVHHILCNILEPIYERVFIFDSYACRVGKGAWRAVLKLQGFINTLRSEPGKKIYCFKGDVSKYFDNIDHVILKRVLRKKIHSPGLLWLIDLIIDSHLVICGIPIGNLTSQLFANIYLNELDHFIKDKLGIKYYIRYMDDFVILSKDKDKLFKLKGLIKEFLETELKLKLHPKKSEYFPIDRGIDFLGYVVFYKDIFLRKSTVKRYFKKLRKRLKKERYKTLELNTAIAEWYSYYHHANNWDIVFEGYSKILDSIYVS